MRDSESLLTTVMIVSFLLISAGTALPVVAVLITVSRRKRALRREKRASSSRDVEWRDVESEKKEFAVLWAILRALIVSVILITAGVLLVKHAESKRGSNSNLYDGYKEEIMIIEAMGLGKTYDGGVEALIDLNLGVHRGEIFGLLGPNGAGKSTTVRLLNGTITPSSGKLTVLGKSSGEECIRKSTSTVAESAQLYLHMSVVDNLLFFARLYDLEIDKAMQRIETLLKQLHIDDRKNDMFGSLSTGMRKRVQLARSLLHRPQVLFLDEPTSGLDPGSAREVAALVRTLSVKEGTTVVLCTHNLALAGQICTRYGFLVRGSLIWSGTREELLRVVMSERIVQITSKRGIERFPIADPRQINSILSSLIETGVQVTDVHLVEPTLEEAYFKIVGENTAMGVPEIREQGQKEGETHESIAS